MTGSGDLEIDGLRRRRAAQLGERRVESLQSDLSRDVQRTAEAAERTAYAQRKAYLDLVRLLLQGGLGRRKASAGLYATNAWYAEGSLTRTLEVSTRSHARLRGSRTQRCTAERATRGLQSIPD